MQEPGGRRSDGSGAACVFGWLREPAQAGLIVRRRSAANRPVGLAQRFGYATDHVAIRHLWLLYDVAMTSGDTPEDHRVHETARSCAS